MCSGVDEVFEVDSIRPSERCRVAATGRLPLLRVVLSKALDNLTPFRNLHLYEHLSGLVPPNVPTEEEVEAAACEVEENVHMLEGQLRRHVARFAARALAAEDFADDLLLAGTEPVHLPLYVGCRLTENSEVRAGQIAAAFGQACAAYGSPVRLDAYDVISSPHITTFFYNRLSSLTRYPLSYLFARKSFGARFAFRVTHVVYAEEIAVVLAVKPELYDDRAKSLETKRSRVSESAADGAWDAAQCRDSTGLSEAVDDGGAVGVAVDPKSEKEEYSGTEDRVVPSSSLPRCVVVEVMDSVWRKDADCRKIDRRAVHHSADKPQSGAGVNRFAQRPDERRKKEEAEEELMRWEAECPQLEEFYMFAQEENNDSVQHKRKKYEGEDNRLILENNRYLHMTYSIINNSDYRPSVSNHILSVASYLLLLLRGTGDELQEGNCSPMGIGEQDDRLMELFNSADLRYAQHNRESVVGRVTGGVGDGGRFMFAGPPSRNIGPRLVEFFDVWIDGRQRRMVIQSLYPQPVVEGVLEAFFF